MPTIDLTDEEHAVVTAAVRRSIADDKYPRAPRLAPLKSALAKLNPASARKAQPEGRPLPGGTHTEQPQRPASTTMKARVFRDQTVPVTWRVESEVIGDAGAEVEVAVFGGPNARLRAIDYALFPVWRLRRIRYSALSPSPRAVVTPHDDDDHLAAPIAPPTR